MAAPATAQLAVNAQSPAVQCMAKQWVVLDALMGGTPAMRDAGASLLPKWPAEEGCAYNARLATATLFPAYRRTVGVMAGKPFAKALTLSDVDGRIESWCENVDLQGNSLHIFAADMFEESFYGLAGILVEFPRVGPAPQGVRTVAAAEAAGLRPYMVRVRHDQVLGWRTGQVGGGLLAMSDGAPGAAGASLDSFVDLLQNDPGTLNPVPTQYSLRVSAQGTGLAATGASPP